MSTATSLVDVIQEYLTSEDLYLPVFPRLAMEVQDMLSQAECNINRVAAKIMEDPALASHLLRVGNSAFFTGLSKVTTVRDAIMRLGTKQVTNLVLMVAQKQQYRSTNGFIRTALDSLWKHAVSCAMGAKWLVEKLGHRALAQEAFLAALLHDIGQLFLLKVLEDMYTSGKYQGTLSKAIIIEVLDTMHAEYGMQLLQRWNLPELYCVIARDHHRDDYDTNDTLLTVVRLVNLACHKVGIGMQHDPSLVLAATSEAQALGASEILLAELEILLEDAMALAD